MKISALLTPAGSAPASAPARQTGDAPEALFNQMLSREIAGRKQPEAPARPAARPADARPEAARAAVPPARTEKPVASEKARAAEGSEEPAEPEETAASTAPTDFLALVNSIAQMQATATGSAIPAQTGETPAEGAPAGRTGAFDIGQLEQLLAAQPATGENAPRPTDAGAVSIRAPVDPAALTSPAADANFAAAMGSAADLQAAATELQATAAPLQAVSAPPAALNQIQSAASQPTDRIAPNVGAPGWNQALGQKVVWMVQGAQQSATLTLNPPDLGPLQIVLNVSNNSATAEFTAAQPEVRQALETAMPRLRDMLNDAGIQLSHANVSAGMPNHQQGTPGGRQGANRSAAADDGDADSAPAVREQAITAGQGLVDTFV